GVVGGGTSAGIGAGGCGEGAPGPAWQGWRAARRRGRRCPRGAVWPGQGDDRPRPRIPRAKIGRRLHPRRRVPAHAVHTPLVDGGEPALARLWERTRRRDAGCGIPQPQRLAAQRLLESRPDSRIATTTWTYTSE